MIIRPTCVSVFALRMETASKGAAARQGFFWWEIDLTYYLLRAMQLVGLVGDLRVVPAGVRATESRVSATRATPRRAASLAEQEIMA